MAESSEPPTPQFAIHTIVPSDYPTLTNISILSYLRNPFHYLTYPPTVAHEHIVSYLQKTEVELPGEGKEVCTFKVVDMSGPAEGQIVGFAAWRLERSQGGGGVIRPPGSDWGFVENFRKRMGPIAGKYFNPETDIELHSMRILPSYQNQGLGTMLLKWGLQQADKLGKRIFVLATPEAKELFEKHGFVSVGDVTMDLEEYGAEGVYVQTAMLWDGSKARRKGG